MSFVIRWRLWRREYLVIYIFCCDMVLQLCLHKSLCPGADINGERIAFYQPDCITLSFCHSCFSLTCCFGTDLWHIHKTTTFTVLRTVHVYLYILNIEIIKENVLKLISGGKKEACVYIMILKKRNVLVLLSCSHILTCSVLATFEFTMLAAV